MKVKSNNLPPRNKMVQQKKLNPFEVHINRTKHQVLGQKRKCDQGLPGISRSKAVQKRKKTLLQEYQRKDKSNQFIDSRIGERNSEMTEDDKIMARFTAERKRLFNKKAKFNLSEPEILTHRGQTLSEIEKFEDTRSDDDEEPGETGALRGRFVSDAHFGGGVLTKSGKDRESLIDQLINESKKRKIERQRNKEDTLEATEQLDEAWKTLGNIVTSKTKDTAEEDTRKNDKYDIVMRQFKFEPQGKVSQKIKTDEELAEEQKKELDKLKNEELKQLREIEAKKYGNHRSADDLDDGFSYVAGVIQEENLNPEMSESSESEAESDEEGIENNENPSFSEEETESSKNSNIKTNKGEKHIPMDCEVSQSSSKSGTKNDSKNVEYNTSTDEKENIIPPKIKKNDVEIDDFENEEDDNSSEISDQEDVEESSTESDDECAMDDLVDLIPSGKKKESESSGQPNRTQQNSVITIQDESKMRDDGYESYMNSLNMLLSTSLPTCKVKDIIREGLSNSNHPEPESENEKRFCALDDYFMQYINTGNVDDGDLNLFPKHGIDLSKPVGLDYIVTLVNDFLLQLEGFQDNSLTCCTQPPSTVTFLFWYVTKALMSQTMGKLAPISKLGLSRICEFLLRVDPLCWRHTLLANLFWTLLFKEAESSSVIYTDAITSAHNCVKCIKDYLNSVCDKCKNGQCQSKGECKSVNTSVQDVIHKYVKHGVSKPNEKSNLKRIDYVFFGSVHALKNFLKVYRKLPQAKLIFKPVQTTFNQIKADDYHPYLAKEISELKSLLQELGTILLFPLQKTSNRPKALRQYEPSFQRFLTAGKFHKALPSEKQEEEKLLHKYKHEMKGAIRELRRDRQFLSNLKLKDKITSDEQRQKKVKEIFGSAANQQGELRRLKKKK